LLEQVQDALGGHARPARKATAPSARHRQSPHSQLCWARGRAARRAAVLFNIQDHKRALISPSWNTGALPVGQLFCQAGFSRACPAGMVGASVAEGRRLTPRSSAPVHRKLPEPIFVSALRSHGKCGATELGYSLEGKNSSTLQPRISFAHCPASCCDQRKKKKREEKEKEHANF